MNKSDYIIDFERVNELTTSIYDDPNDKSNPMLDGKFAFSISRKVIREYLDNFNSYNPISTHSDLIKDKVKHVIETLEYNGILLHKSTIRDKKIDKILE
jgi:hypothetical protein